MNNNLFMVVIFWGVWIIIPVLFDGVLAFFYMLVIVFHEKRKAFSKHAAPQLSALDPAQMPLVSIIIPTYNEEENINQCLNYLKIQTYPQDKIEIIVVDNGSTDETSDIVKEQMQEIWRAKQGDDSSTAPGAGKLKVNGETYETKGFGGLLRLVVRYEKGKAKALNSGIRLARGEIIINIDSRSFLAPDAIYNVVKKFTNEPKYGAVTGNVEIDWQIIYNRDQYGHYLLDRQGHYQPRVLSLKERFLGKSQFMEYLTSFRLGREFQDITGSMYTFSGAFSAFRREVLLNSSLYQSRTVAEDTDLTLDLHGQNIRLGFVKDAKAYLKPVISLEKFYSQRVRWYRGQIETIGVHLDWYGNLRKGFWRNLWLALLLMVDHTFSFPRIIWIFMLPLFFLFGYSMTLIVTAIFLMYAFYVLMDFLNAWYCYRVTNNETRAKIQDSIQYCLVTPFFRLLTFYFRFAGHLEVLKEPQAWSAPVNPVRSVKKYRSSLRGSYHKTLNLGLRVWQFVSGQKATEPVYYDDKIAELDDYGQNQPDVPISPKSVPGK